MLRKAAFAFVFALSIGSLMLPLTVQAQQTGKVYRIGVLSFTTFENTTLAAVITEGLASLGYTVGRNIVIEEKSIVFRRLPRNSYASTSTSSLPATPLQFAQLRMQRRRFPSSWRSVATTQ